MKLLALYTASEPASAALLADGASADGEVADGRTVERLAPLAAELLARRGLSAAALDGVAVASGPGSFTGLRVGAATALGLARGAGLALFAAGTLDVWAAADQADAAAGGGASARPAEASLWVVLDARRGEVYAARYEVLGAGGRPRRVEGPVALPVGEAAARLAGAGARVIGDGRPLLESAGLAPSSPGHARPTTTLALALARLVESSPVRLRCGVAGLRLDYLRQPQAVLRRAAGFAPAAAGEP